MKHNMVTYYLNVNIRCPVIILNYIHAGVDYRLLRTVFVFHSWVNNLTVPIEVHNDTIGEVPEHFYLSFRNHCPQDFRNHSIQPHENGVTVSILDSNEYQ